MTIHVYNTPNNQLRWCKEEVPAEPKAYMPETEEEANEAHADQIINGPDLRYSKYRADLERIKKESVPFENHNEIFLELVPKDSKDFKLQPDTFYSFQWGGTVEVEYLNINNPKREVKEIASLVPDERTQEHLWEESLRVGDVKTLLEKFNITRK